MPLPLKRFMGSYLKALQEGNAAVFAGAGLSVPSGHLNWKQLLRGAAEDLSLDINRETDLLALAQYHENEFGRGRMNQVLLDEFCRQAEPNKNHRILAGLPIRSFWTTNYDTLIENALRSVGKSVDVKTSTENLALTVSGHDAVVYKMHGDASAPDRAVLTKNDYETYHNDRRLFMTALQSELASKTFLFIGFSFSDPNLDAVLSRMRSMLGSHVRPHYCLMRQEVRSEEQSDAEFAYAETKQKLKIRDLARYGIHVILVESYERITEVLEELQLLVRRNCVFVSGSAERYADWGEERFYEFGRSMGRALVEHGFRVATGYGLGVGDSVIRGVLQQVNRRKNATEKILHLGCLPDPNAAVAEWSQYRSDMLNMSGVAIFLFGNKIDPSGKPANATGMFEEFEIGHRQGVVPIPVGATRFAAEELWRKVMADFDTYVPNPSLKPYYEDLGVDSGLTDAELVETVMNIITTLASP